MSFHKQSRSLPEQFRLVLASFLQRPGLPFADALSQDAIQRAFDDENASFADDEDAVYTPAVTLWASLSQVLFKDEQRSCVVRLRRIARVVVLLGHWNAAPVPATPGPIAEHEGSCRRKSSINSRST